MFTGNREFNEIYEKYKNLVLKAAYMYSGDNYEAAQDITQETFLKTCTLGLRRILIKRESTIRGFITTAKNAALNYRKKSQKRSPRR